ncbi:MAG: T9SS type A sorting domain-containing protein [Flavobacteriales bacterium]
MRFSRLVRLPILLAAAVATSVAHPQQPFNLDVSFSTSIGQQYVSSVLPLADGSVVASGIMRFDGELSDMRLVKLLPSGTRDESFYNSGLGQGKLVPWDSGLFYVASASTVRRILPTGYQDPAFIALNSGPYFSSFQGGDYHVFEDGRVVLGGRHMLSDSIRGFVGAHCLTWFSNQGYLDTTRTHRPCNGVLTTMKELPNGQFMGSGSMSTWEGQPASRIFRFNADGSLDPAFQANAIWGAAYCFLPLPDGRVYAGGQFRIAGIPDTLNLVRFMPDGALDASFDNTVRYRFEDLLHPELPPWGLVRTVYPLNGEQLIVTGNFSHINGVPRGGIALVDDSGSLLNDYFTGEGCGGYFYQPNTSQPPVSYARVVSGIAPSPDGQYFIWGAYHGYDDGTTNDTLQRMVSRLHGFNVRVPEVKQVHLRAYPNPAKDNITIEIAEFLRGATAVLRDAWGREVLRQELTEQATHLSTRTLSNGIYSIQLLSTGRSVDSQRLFICR